MSEWFRRLIEKHTDDCFYCLKKVDKKEAFSVKLNTSDGQVVLKTCPTCADDLNDILKKIEEARDEGL